MSDYQGSDRREAVPPGWHLKKEIQLSHVISIVVIAISAIVYFGKMEQRLAVMESQIATQRERDDRQDKAVAEAFMLIRAQLEKMDSKLDRALERSK